MDSLFASIAGCKCFQLIGDAVTFDNYTLAGKLGLTRLDYAGPGNALERARFYNCRGDEAMLRISADIVAVEPPETMVQEELVKRLRAIPIDLNNIIAAPALTEEAA